MAYTAVVTGASGFVATEVVKQLLEKGYNVRGTVRSLSSKEKVAHLELLGASLPGELTLHEADLLKPGSFDEVVKGADFVFHTASPFFREVQDPMKDLVEPAMHGTQNVLSSVAKSKDTVKRVIQTSSFAAIVKMEAGPQNGKVFTEEDWNTESKPDMEGGYNYSKTEAEKAGWEFSKKEGISLVCINPTFVLGPVVGKRADGQSIMDFKAFIEGSYTQIMPFQVDVRDIGRAHVRAAEVPEAHGRYLVSHTSTISTRTLSDTLSKCFPQYRFPEGTDEPVKEVVDNSKVQKELGIKLHDLTETYIDMATTLIQNGIAKPVPK